MSSAPRISQLPQIGDEVAAKRNLKAYPIGYFYIDIAEARAVGKRTLWLLATLRVLDRGQQHMQEEKTKLIGMARIRWEQRVERFDRDRSQEARRRQKIKMSGVCEQAHQQMKEEFGLRSGRLIRKQETASNLPVRITVL